MHYALLNVRPSYGPPGSQLLQELKKMDDKALLVEVQLLESKTYHALSNLPKARAALTSARTTANGIYCQPKLQAALDMQSGEWNREDAPSCFEINSFYFGLTHLHLVYGLDFVLYSVALVDGFYFDIVRSLLFVIFANIRSNCLGEAGLQNNPPQN